MEQEEKKISKFSSGLNIITRLDVLWRNCQNFKRNGLYQKWNDELDSVWLELARDLSDEDYKDKKEEETITKGMKSQFDSFEDKLKKYLPFHDSITGFKLPEKDIVKNRDEQYKILMDKQLFLARLENELGKGTTHEDEDEDF